MSDGDYIGKWPDDFDPSGPEAPAAPDELLARFVTLDSEKTQLATRIDEIKKEMQIVEETLLAEWADRGVQSVKLTNRMVYIRRDFYCIKKGGVESKEVCAVLKRSGYAQMVNPSYAPASLKALVREMVDTDTPVPAELDALVKYDTIPRLRTRAS